VPDDQDHRLCRLTDTSRQVGDKDHLKIFASVESAEAWLAENDPEGVAFEHDVIDASPGWVAR